MAAVFDRKLDMFSAQKHWHEQVRLRQGGQVV
jgi:hypothetical protein